VRVGVKVHVPVVDLVTVEQIDEQSPDSLVVAST
jgi:hypothetical protein